MQKTPLPLKTMSILCAVIVSEPISLTLLFPFIYYMVRDFGYRQEEIGYYVGWIASSFSLAQFMTAYGWGFLSDRIGRRPVLLIGLIGNSISTCLFGLSKNLLWAVLSRSICGVLNGNIGIAKCVLGEITDSTNQAAAFSLIGLNYGLGSIIGPALGGLLSHPTDNIPSLADNQFLKTYPYFLPCFVSSLISTVGFVVGFFFLPETNKNLSGHQYQLICEPVQDEENVNFAGLENTTNNYGSVNRNDTNDTLDCNAVNNEIDALGYNQRNIDRVPDNIFDKAITYPLGQVEYSADSDDSLQTQTSTYSIASTGQESTETSTLETSTGLGMESIAAALAYALLSFESIIFTEVFPIWSVVSLKFTSKDVGILFSIIGVVCILCQVTLYPFASRFYSPLLLFKYPLYGMILVFVTMPMIPIYLVDSNLSGYLWPAVIVMMSARAILENFLFTSAMLLVNNSARKGKLGLANGLAQGSSSLMRSIGPALGGSLWAWSQNGKWFPFNDTFIFSFEILVLGILCGQVWVMFKGNT